MLDKKRQQMTTTSPNFLVYKMGKWYQALGISVRTGLNMC